MHGQSRMKSFTYSTACVDSNTTIIFQKSHNRQDVFFISTTELLTMSRAEVQESAEYYKWLLCIERAKFEKELLEIVSSHTC